MVRSMVAAGWCEGRRSRLRARWTSMARLMAMRRSQKKMLRSWLVNVSIRSSATRKVSFNTSSASSGTGSRGRMARRYSPSANQVNKTPAAARSPDRSARRPSALRRGAEGPLIGVHSMGPEVTRTDNGLGRTVLHLPGFDTPAPPNNTASHERAPNTDDADVIEGI